MKFQLRNNPNVTKICITGGACAGKTTALTTIAQELITLGYKVLFVPEAATMMMKCGALINMVNFTPKDGLAFQKSLIGLQIGLEDTFMKIANLPVNRRDKFVILCDRGLMDGSAFVPKDTWEALLHDLGFNTFQLKDKRYDAVVHLVSAADGAEEFYTLGNNEARYDDI